jgi:hypothetical protein
MKFFSDAQAAKKLKIRKKIVKAVRAGGKTLSRVSCD